MTKDTGMHGGTDLRMEGHVPMNHAGLQDDRGLAAGDGLRPAEDERAAPLLSVLVAACNVEAYLRGMLDSLHIQTLQEAEFIIVDDGSSDGTPQIARAYTQTDPRFRIITHEQNRSLMMARRTGVEAARGRYVMFADGDDEYSTPDALERIVHEMERQGVDVLHFGAIAVPEPSVPEKRAEWMNAFLMPFDGRIDGTEEILRATIGRWQYAAPLWNKIFRAEVVRKAYACVPDGRIHHAEDWYAAFLILYHSVSFAGVQGMQFYRYRYGRGTYGRASVSIDQFNGVCSTYAVPERLRRFLEDRNDLDRYGSLIRYMNCMLVRSCVSTWSRDLSAADAAKGFDMMCGAWEPLDVVVQMAQLNWNMRRQIAQRVAGAECLKRRTGKIGTIAIYYYWLTVGGVQRVISQLAEMWAAEGYNVIVITDTEPGEKEFPLPEGVRRFSIPSFQGMTGDKYAQRAEALCGILRENGVDLLDYHAWTSPLLLWDTLAAKTMGIAVHYHTHNISSCSLLKGFGTMPERFAVAALMDGISVLSRADAELYRCTNANVHYISNPIDVSAVSSMPRAALDSRTVMWCGRFAGEKRPLSAVRVFKLVHDQVPGAKLLMVGGGSEDFEKKVRLEIAANGLEDAVICTGITDCPEQYYLQAGVLMMTSEFEGHPMVMQEALSYGVPVVTYAMDYLEMVRCCPSVISVPQLDEGSLADAVIRLLQNDNERKERGEQAREEIRAYAESSRVSEKWKRLFASMEQEDGLMDCSDSYRILMNTIMEHMSIGAHTIQIKAAEEQEKRHDIWIKLKKTQEEKSAIWHRFQDVHRQKSGVWRELQEARREKSGIWHELQDAAREKSDVQHQMQEARKEMNELLEHLQLARNERETLRCRLEDECVKLETAKEQLAAARQQLEKERAQKEAVLSSRSYKLAQVIAYIPRRIRQATKRLMGKG